MIAEEAFADCKNLKTICFPKELLWIRQNAFAGCTGLTGTLTIPDNIRLIESDAFPNCKNLKKIKISQQTMVSKGHGFRFEHQVKIERY